MAKIIDLGEHHVGRRYVVSGIKGRIKEFVHEQDAYAYFYFLESSEWTQACEEKWLKKKEFTIDKLVAFYYGERCYRYNLTRSDKRRLSKNTLRKAYSSFKYREQFSEIANQSLTAVAMPDVQDLNLGKSRLIFLQDAYRCAISHNICVLNPVSKLIHKPEKQEAQCATEKQVKELLLLAEKQNKPRLWLTIKLGSELGLRIGEVNGLHWNAFDMGRVHIKQQKKDEGGFDDCKNRSNRRLMVNEALYCEWLGEFDAEFTSKLGLDVPLFDVKNDQLNNCFRRLSKELGYDLGFHSLRHHCASRLILQGEQISAVSKFLGHKDVATTLSVYAHLIEDRFEVVIG